MIIFGTNYHAVQIISYPTVGLAQYRAIQLCANDFRGLRAMTPEQLKEWVDQWALGFEPEPEPVWAIMGGSSLP